MKKLTVASRTILIGTILLVAGAVAAAGSLRNESSSAASTAITIEAEKGTVLAPAVAQPDSTASGVGSVVFSAPKTGFVHPGVLVSRAQLDFVKTKAAAGQRPWSNALDKAKGAAGFATRAPHLSDMVQQDDPSAKCNPAAGGAAAACVVNCGSYSNPDDGCNDETTDADAAYTQALLWYYTGQESYAQSAVAMLNGWSAVLKTHTGSNAPLQASWAAAVFTRAAEIIRYTYTPPAGKPSFNVDQFITLLRTAYLPVINGKNYGNTNGNWELSAIEARQNIAVFTNDRTAFAAANNSWRARTPAYIYLTTDGALPKVPPQSAYTSKASLSCFWLNSSPNCATASTVFHNGQSQETCRDMEHTGMGFASMINAAETARIQGIDLYGEEKSRIVAGLEYNTNLLNTVTGTDYPADFCKGGANFKAPKTQPTFEIAYNHYANRLHMSLPSTKQTVERLESGPGSASGYGLMMVYETLTHNGTP